MKAPWFPFYTGDFLASPDVQLMEAATVGAYTLLLAFSWQSDTPGYIEDDEYMIRRVSRLSAAEWDASKKVILKKWPVAEDMPGYRCNPRLKKEADKQVVLRSKKAEAGQKSAEIKAARKAEADRLATEGQQKANTISTPVEIASSDVGKTGNYSQPQPQSQTSKDVGRSDTHANPQVLASPVEEKKKPAWEVKDDKPKPREYSYDTAPILLATNFFPYLDSINYGHVDKATYLMQISAVGRERMITCTDANWKKFITNYLNNDKRDHKLLLPDASQNNGQSATRRRNLPVTR